MQINELQNTLTKKQHILAELSAQVSEQILKNSKTQQQLLSYQ